MVKNNTENVSIKDQMIDSALALAAIGNWGEIDFDDIIADAQIDRKEVLEYFDDKGDILIAYGRLVDKQMIENAALKPLGDVEITEENQSLIRERLFDLIMERFDVLNENRSAVLSILGGIKFDPKQAIIALPHLTKSIGRILEEAGETLGGIKGCAKITGLTAVYLYTVKSWCDDDTADMAKTMAVLDKSLGFAEEAANTLSGGDILGLFSKVKESFSKN